VSVPLKQKLHVGAYLLKQRLKGNKRYPLVLMLEPLFRCNLACAGCGKIDYPDPILNKRLSVQECLDAVDECGAPMVAIPGGEPLLHKEIGEIVAGIVARKKYVILCTNALLLEKKLHLFTPSPYLTFSIHLDGDRGDHDRSVCQDGVFDKAVAAARVAKAKGFRVNANATLFANADPERMANFFDACMDEIGIDMLTISPGYAYERAPDQQHFLNRQKTRELFRDIFRRDRKRKWRFSQSSLFLDFLAGNQTYHCTPWSNPTRNVFGWQKPCYLLGEGFVRSFKELMETTEWDSYGTGRYEKCADCMVHCGYEGTAVDDTFARPWKALKVALRGIKTDGPMAPDIALDKSRPAQYVFEKQVQEQVALIHDSKGKRSSAA
jgi:hopanoid biosynthesis associated radical SAM protein HpnH